MHMQPHTLLPRQSVLTVAQARTQPGKWKLGDWLADAETVAMFTSGMIKTLTFKAVEFGPNITKATAISNSAEWEMTEDPGESSTTPLTTPQRPSKRARNA